MKHLKHNLLPLITLAAALVLAQNLTALHNLDLPIENKTPYWASVGVHYPHCKDDHTVIAPGDRVVVAMKTCSPSRIEGVLAPVIGDPSKNIVIQGELINPELGAWKDNQEVSPIKIIPTEHGSYKFSHTPYWD